MKIYTKSGDTGTTSLVGGSRVSKSHPRVEAYGDIDELISHIGLLRVELDSRFEKELRHIQECLMLGAAHVASDGLQSKLSRFPDSEIGTLEEYIDDMTALMPRQTAFILPAGPKNAALCHIARTVCRRAERAIVALDDSNPQIQLTIRFLNRLSDYLFTLGRFQCYLCDISEDFWLP